jgi:hypothetical protein
MTRRQIMTVLDNALLLHEHKVLNLQHLGVSRRGTGKGRREAYGFDDVAKFALAYCLFPWKPHWGAAMIAARWPHPLQQFCHVGSHRSAMASGDYFILTWQPDGLKAPNRRRADWPELKLTLASDFDFDAMRGKHDGFMLINLSSLLVRLHACYLTEIGAVL